VAYLFQEGPETFNMRAIWTGGIRFGLVYIPVKLYSGATTHNLDLDMLRKDDACPIKYTRVCKHDGEEVPWNDIVKGFKEDDYYIVLNKEDFEKASKEKSESIDITDFVKIEQISPRYFEKPYLVEPQKGAGSTYNLLRQAIAESGMGGLAKFVMRNREHLALLMADEEVIFLIKMRYRQDLRNPSKLKLPKKKKAGKKELEMAKKLIEQMKGDFDPARYKDTYQEKLKKIIKAKAKDKQFEPAAGEEAPEPTAVKDLMDQLKRSLASTS
jgi:DNA end-binding protein Ku